MPQSFLSRLALGDVSDDPLHLHRDAFGIAMRAALSRDPTDAGIGPNDPVLDIERHAQLDGFPDRLIDALPIVGMDAFKTGLVVQLDSGRDPENGAEPFR